MSCAKYFSAVLCAYCNAFSIQKCYQKANLYVDSQFFVWIVGDTVSILDSICNNQNFNFKSFNQVYLKKVDPKVRIYTSSVLIGY